LPTAHSQERWPCRQACEAQARLIVLFIIVNIKCADKTPQRSAAVKRFVGGSRLQNLLFTRRVLAFSDATF
jgi:hypothetical protein